MRAEPDARTEGGMEAEKYVMEYLRNHQYAENYGNEEDGYALLAARQMYEITGDEDCFSFIKKYFDMFLSENGEVRNKSDADFLADWINGSRCLFFLCDKTGEEKYRKALEVMMEKLRRYPRCGCGNFVSQKERLKEVSADTLYRIQPFYMEYETVYDKKEKYNDIISQFENAQKMLYDDEKGLCCQAYDEEKGMPRMEDGEDQTHGFQVMSTAQYLAALVDTMDSMSIEIYEQYRKLQDMFKQALKGILEYRDEKSGFFMKKEAAESQSGVETDISGSALIGYCILKACHMGILLKEKYVDTGMEIVEKLSALEEPKKTGVFFLAYAQYLQMKKELEA